MASKNPPAIPTHHKPPAAPKRVGPQPKGDRAGGQGGSRGGKLPAKPSRGRGR
jgi:hypothetical protein